VSKKINTTSIGLFIVTGVALGVIGLLLFSSFKLFSPTRKLILYFDSSLNGLNVGAPVKYRGVTIGSVKQVMIRFNQAPNDFSMPVLIELEKKLLKERMHDDSMEVFTEQSLAKNIKLGLRATLDTESLVTGILYINLSFSANAEPAVFHQLKPIYPEVPTQPTQVQEILKNLSSLDIKSIEKNLNALLAKLDTTVDSLHMADINRGVTNLLVSVDRLVNSPDITNDLAAVRTTLDQYRLVGEKLTGRIDPLADSITNTLAEATRTLGQIRGAGENLRTLLAPDSPLRNNLDQALQQLAGAAQSISALAEFLKQHPNALIAGRENQPKKP
jgi:phospholipid/cholesterol/gamma-HCH transport system substrate-binding protein